MSLQNNDSVLRELIDALLYIMHVDSWLTLGVLALILSLLRWIGTLPGPLPQAAFPLARFVWFVYFYLVMRKAASGSRRLPALFDYLDTWDALIQPLLQVIFSTIWCWLPILIYVVNSVGLADFFDRYQSHASFMLSQKGVLGYIFIGFSIFFIPTALINSLCIRKSFFQSLDPLAGFLLIRRIPYAYSKMYVLIILLGLFNIFMDVLGEVIEATLPIPLASTVMSHLVRLWIPLTQARFMGGFVFQNKPYLLDNLEETDGFSKNIISRGPA